MTTEEFIPYKGKRIEFTTNSGANYAGVLSGVQKQGGGRIIITDLQVWSKGLDYPILAGGGITRGFWVSKIATFKGIQ